MNKTLSIFLNDISTSTRYYFLNRNYKISTFIVQNDIGSLIKEYLISDVSVPHAVLETCKSSLKQ